MKQEYSILVMFKHAIRTIGKKLRESGVNDRERELV